MDTGAIIKMAIAAIAGAGAFIARSAVKQKAADAEQAKKTKSFSTFMFVLMIICGWYLIGIIISEFAGGPGGLKVNFEMFSPRTVLFGISFANSTIITWIIIAVVSILSLIFRFILFPKFSEKPKGFQNIIELAVEAMNSFTRNTTGGISDELPAYMFSIAVLLVSCAAAELFGQRPPTADLIMTFSLGLATFFLINFFGIKKKGIGGRLKSLASPSPIIFPMKILSDISVPVSLACRLFGNMLGGMIVMDLLKSSLGGYAVGFTALAGLYFNLFHPLIQTYIFIILSLTFINEAVEDQ
jgi:F-type H+-transporting ATPase subunit a